MPVLVNEKARRLMRQKCLFAKARPEWVLRYFSKASALSLSRKATAVWMRQGRDFEGVPDFAGIMGCQPFL